MVIRGRCLCGAVAYEVRLPIAKFVNCYCSRCRKASGSAYAANAYVSPQAFQWIRGENLVVRYDLPEPSRRPVCIGTLVRHGRPPSPIRRPWNSCAARVPHPKLGQDETPEAPSFMISNLFAPEDRACCATVYSCSSRISRILHILGSGSIAGTVPCLKGCWHPFLP